MASSLSRKLLGVVFSRYPTVLTPSSLSFCTKSLPSSETESQLDSELESLDLTSNSSSSNNQRQVNVDRPLENGFDSGIYKAILVGQVGQAPFQKKLKSGHLVTLISLGTGGIRNNRRPLYNEDPKEYATRCDVQWHRVSVYPERLGELAVKNLFSGSILYVEGNLETKIFNDPITGLVRRIREVAVRRNGRILLLGSGGETRQFTKAEMAGVGYY